MIGASTDSLDQRNMLEASFLVLGKGKTSSRETIFEGGSITSRRVLMRLRQEDLGLVPLLQYCTYRYFTHLKLSRTLVYGRHYGRVNSEILTRSSMASLMASFKVWYELLTVLKSLRP